MKTLLSIIMLWVSSAICASEIFSIYLVRHAQKQLEHGKDPELTAKGVQTAKDLAALLEHTNLQAIYSTDYKRTQQTAKPLANKLKLSVISYDPTKLELFAQQRLNQGKDILVVGHSNTTPSLITALGGTGLEIDESRYGDVYQLVFFKDKSDNSAKLVKQTKLTIPGAP